MGYGLDPLPDKNSSIFLFNDEPIVFPPQQKPAKPIKIVYEGQGKIRQGDEYITIPVEIHILKPKFYMCDVSHLTDKEIEKIIIESENE